MRCDVDCWRGTIMMPAPPGRSFGYLILCPACRGTGSFICKPEAAADANRAGPSLPQSKSVCNDHHL